MELNGSNSSNYQPKLRLLTEDFCIRPQKTLSEEILEN